MNCSLSLATSDPCQFIDITARVQAAVTESQAKDGLAMLFVPHTTAGITINENADPDVRRDILQHLDKMIPASRDFRHFEGNSPAHVKASLMGPSLMMPIMGGKLRLGTWQGIYFCEFDGPRNRQVLLTIVET